MLHNLSNFARVGKGPALKAIGLQKNYKEYYTEYQQLDEAASGCFACPHYKYKSFLEYMPREIQENISHQCGSCSKAVYKTAYKSHIKYINEKNMYGYQPRLKGNALKLLITYHFLSPSPRGFISDVSEKELAEFIKCDIKTIKYSNEVLAKYGYISYHEAGWERNHISVLLPEYNTYHLTASEGGRGYATISKELLQQILNIKDVNQLRIYLRALMESDASSAAQVKLERSYEQLRRYLPGYCKPNVIKKALVTESDIFSVECENSKIVLHLNAAYNTRQAKLQLIEENRGEMQSYITALNDMLDQYNLFQEQPNNEFDDLTEQLRAYGINTYIDTNKKLTNNTYPPVILKDNDYRDLGLLSTTYSLTVVKQTMIEIYNTYILPKRPIESIGALTRTIIKKEALFSKAS